MRSNLIKYFLCTAAVMLYHSGFSQDDKTLPLITADSLASGNYKDVLTSFFQIAVENLTGLKKDFRLSTNPFAIMLKADPSLALDTKYKKYTYLRNLNFSVDARLDDNYHFNGFASGIKYAIINERDVTISDEFIDLVLIKNNEYHVLNDGIVQQSQGVKDASLKSRLRLQGHKLFTDSNFTFNQLDTDVKNLVMKIIADSNLTSFNNQVKLNPKINFYRSIHQGYNDIKNSFQNKLLWTAGISDTSYSNKFSFSNVVLSTELLKGILNPKALTNIELDLKASLNFIDDSVKTGNDLKRHVFSFEPGLNWVLKSGNKNNPQSIAEFKLSGGCDFIVSHLYKNEKRSNITLNGTLRLRILNDIWVPLQFKYDPSTGNVFGVLNVRFNFTGMNNSAGSKK